MEIYTFRRRASCGDMGSGDMVVAILRSSHDESRELQKVEAPSRLKAANSRQRRKSSASSSSDIPYAADSIKSTPTVSLVPPGPSCTPSPFSHRTQWRRPSLAWRGTQQNGFASGPPPHAHPSPVPATEDQSQSRHLVIMPPPPQNSLPNIPAPA